MSSVSIWPVSLYRSLISLVTFTLMSFIVWGALVSRIYFLIPFLASSLLTYTKVITLHIFCIYPAILLQSSVLRIFWWSLTVFYVQNHIIYKERSMNFFLFYSCSFYLFFISSNVLASVSRALLNKSGKKQCPWLVPDFRADVFSSARYDVRHGSVISSFPYLNNSGSSGMSRISSKATPHLLKR